MANVFDWFFEQLVTEAELDEAFSNLEAADRNLVADQGYFGVYQGLGTTEASVPDLTVDIDAGRAYDQTGRRIFVPAAQNLDVSVDSNASSTAVAGGGNEKYVSVFVRFTRALSDQRFDGNASPVFFRRDESFEFVVVQGAEAPAGTAARPALLSDGLLIADILRSFGQTQIFDADIESSDTASDPNSRFQFAFNLTSSSPAEIRVGPLPDAMQAILTELNNHITNVANPHPSSAITFDAANLPIPATWTDVAAATEMQAAIDGIVNDLAQTDGAELVGFADGSAGWADASNLAAATIDAALEEIVGDLGAAGGAALIGNTAAGNIAATDVQAAINELDSEKGGLALTNTWTAIQTFSAATVHDGQTNFNNNVRLTNDVGAFTNMFADWRTNTVQAAHGGGTETIATLYTPSDGTAGFVEGIIVGWSDDSEDDRRAARFFTQFGRETGMTTTSLNVITDENDGGAGIGITGYQMNLSGSSIVINALNTTAATTNNYMILWRVASADGNQ